MKHNCFFSPLDFFASKRIQFGKKLDLTIDRAMCVMRSANLKLHEIGLFATFSTVFSFVFEKKMVQKFNCFLEASKLLKLLTTLHAKTKRFYRKVFGKIKKAGNLLLLQIFC